MASEFSPNTPSITQSASSCGLGVAIEIAFFQGHSFGPPDFVQPFVGFRAGQSAAKLVADYVELQSVRDGNEREILHDDILCFMIGFDHLFPLCG
jgi:hypothetical protein